MVPIDHYGRRVSFSSPTRPSASGARGSKAPLGGSNRLPSGRERRPALAALAVILILLGAAGSALIALRSGDRTDYVAVAPNPADFFPFLERMQPVVHEWSGWTDDQIRSVTAPTLLVIGDNDFTRLDHAAEMLDLFPNCRLAVLPATRHTEVMQRPEQLRAIVEPFLT